MNKITKIILSILGALFTFLLGVFTHAWVNREKVKEEVKKAIKDLNKENKKAFTAMKDSYEEKLRKKDTIIKKLNEIIDRLLNLFIPMAGSNNKEVDKLIDNLKKNKDKLNDL